MSARIQRLKRIVVVRWGRLADRCASKPLAYLLRYLPRYSFKLLISGIFMAIAGSLSSFISVLVGKLTDEGFVSHNPDVIWWAPLSLVGITAASGLSIYLGSYLLEDVSQSIILTIRAKLFRRLNAWPMSFIREETLGNLMTIFINLVTGALGEAAGIVTVLVRDTLNLMCLIAVLFWHDWKLTLVTFVITPLIVFLIRKIKLLVKKVMGLAKNMMDGMANLLHEDFTNYKVIKIFDCYKKEEKRFSEFSNLFRDFSIKMQMVSASSDPLTQMIMMVGVSVVVIVALLESQSGYLTLGDFVTFLSALMLITMPLKHLSGLSSSIAKFEFAAEAVWRYMMVPVERIDQGVRLNKPLSGDIVVENLSYKYPNGDYVLKDISFTVKRGQMVALVGASGAGKSTLINIFPRFNEIQEGRILFDGIDFKSLSLNYLRENLSLVNQEVMLFNTSIEENISFGRENAQSQEIREAAEAANLGNFINSLPDGILTRIGTQGCKLSGGQRQRVSIARAFLKKAPILLLDEATSALDTVSERIIQTSLERLMKTCTTIVVAHRLSTVINADLILVMDKGSILEQGTHQELLRKNGIYAKLFRLQYSK